VKIKEHIDQQASAERECGESNDYCIQQGAKSNTKSNPSSLLYDTISYHPGERAHLAVSMDSKESHVKPVDITTGFQLKVQVEHREK